MQLCIWNIDGWEKKKARLIQAPPGHPTPLVGETRVQFHNDQSHILVVHESQIAIYDTQLECLRSVSFHLMILVLYTILCSYMTLTDTKLSYAREFINLLSKYYHCALPSALLNLSILSFVANLSTMQF